MRVVEDCLLVAQIRYQWYFICSLQIVEFPFKLCNNNLSFDLCRFQFNLWNECDRHYWQLWYLGKKTRLLSLKSRNFGGNFGKKWNSLHSCKTPISNVDNAFVEAWKILLAISNQFQRLVAIPLKSNIIKILVFRPTTAVTNRTNKFHICMV